MLDPQQVTKRSKFLSLILRHDPGRIDLTMDAGGWVNVGHLVDQARAHGVRLSRDDVETIVAENNKQRFALSEDGTRIRANQGHSIEVDLGLAPVRPPDVLFHGTADRFRESILKDGLVKRSRQHVHLSADVETATLVGQRHGRLWLLIVDAARMHKAGHPFYLSDNGVWLTDAVPPGFFDPVP